MPTTKAAAKSQALPSKTGTKEKAKPKVASDQAKAKKEKIETPSKPKPTGPTLSLKSARKLALSDATSVEAVVRSSQVQAYLKNNGIISKPERALGMPSEPSGGVPVSKLYDKLDEFKMSVNRYVKAVTNPFNSFGVKIPSGNQPSVCASFTKKIPIRADENGNAFVFVGLCPEFTPNLELHGDFVGLNANVANIIPTQYGLRALDETSEPVTCVFENVVGCYGPKDDSTAIDATDLMKPSVLSDDSDKVFSEIRLPGWGLETANTLVEDNFYSARLVGGGLAVMSTGSQFTDQGTITLVSLPAGTYNPSTDFITAGPDGGRIAMNNIGLFPNAVVVPVNQEIGGTTLYFPTGTQCFTYHTLVSKSECYVRDIVSNLNNLPAVAAPGYLLMAISGAKGGVDVETRGSFYVDIVLSYELLPKTSSIMLTTATDATDDELEVQHTLDVLAVTPPCFAGTIQIEKTNGFGGNGGRMVGSEQGFHQFHFAPTWPLKDHTMIHIDALTGKKMVVGVIKSGKGVNWKGLGKTIGGVLTNPNKTIRMIDRLVTEWAPAIQTAGKLAKSVGAFV